MDLDKLKKLIVEDWEDSVQGLVHFVITAVFMGVALAILLLPSFILLKLFF